ncbi:MAG: arabinofuranosyltransferase [Planctomycetota bacterium]|jgi:arabinofuranosyltransferase
MKRSSIWYLIPPLLALLHGLWFLGTGPVDDDYICFRYAQNLVEGHGLVFNVGERFEGFSTPLWVLMHALWQFLGGSSPDLSVGVGIASLAACSGVLALHALRKDRLPLAALVVAAAPAMAWHAVAGLGTVLLSLCLLGAYLAQQQAEQERRPAWGAALWLAVTCLLRQECVLFVVPFAIAQWRAGFRLPAILPLAALVSWTLFRLGYYGRLLPITYHAKRLPLADDLAYGARYFLAATRNFALPLWLVLAAWGGLRGEGFHARKSATLGAIVYVLYVVSVGGDFMVLSRFFIPALPLLLCLAFEALQGRRKVALALALVASLAMQWDQVVDSELGSKLEARATRLQSQQGFKQRWTRLGEHFKVTVPAGSRVAISPIGAFGWASELPLVDILGLTNDSVLDVEPDLEFISVKGHHRNNFDWILDQNPEYVILGNGVRDQRGNIMFCPWERDFVVSLNEGTRFDQEYRQAFMEIPNDYLLDLFIRRDLPLPARTQWVVQR